MKIAVIGGGFTGLTAAYELGKRGHRVVLFEKEETLGGLAHGFKRPNWEWHLEAAYHHLFANDTAILALIRELGLTDSLIPQRPITAVYWSRGAGSRSPRNGNIYQFDSPYHLLAFPGLSTIDKLRTGFLLAFLKLNPFWKPLEDLPAREFLIRFGGIRAWRTIWEPLMVSKFGTYAPEVAASWFWARIKKRTQKIYYIAGGFHTLVEALAQAIINQGGTIYTKISIHTIKEVSRGTYSVLWGKQKQQFDRILLTVPTPIAFNICPLIRNTNTEHLLSIPHLHAQTLILETKEPILKTTYWLNVTDRSFPFLAVVAHTNFTDPKYYGGHHITYFGNYLPTGHKYLSMTNDQLLKVFIPYIKRLNPSMNYKRITNTYLFTGPFAQPVHLLHYSRLAPKIRTPMKGVYLANLDSIVPWDRGTNYAVELGTKAARVIAEGG